MKTTHTINGYLIIDEDGPVTHTDVQTEHGAVETPFFSETQSDLEDIVEECPDGEALGWRVVKATITYSL